MGMFVFIWPDVVSHFFAYSNLVDKHNQVWQDELGLEKCWVISDPYFRLTTRIVASMCLIVENL